MKHLIVLSILVIIGNFALSCRNNRLKTNQKELTREMLSQEESNKAIEKVTSEKDTSEIKTIYKGTFRKKQVRSIDSRRPPIIIDLLGTSNNVREIKLSDVASTVKYVKLETPPDTDLLYDPSFFRSDLNSIVRSDGEQIIFQGLFGLTRFNMQGEYLETIWKNKTGIDIHGNRFMYGGKDFFGVGLNTPISMANGSLYYSFQNGPKGNGLVMKYKVGIDNVLPALAKTEIPEPGTIHGDTLLNTKKNPLERFDRIFGIGPDTWAGLNQKWNAGRYGSFLVTYNDRGDTICQFTDYDRIINFTGSFYRTLETPNYIFNGLLTIKQEYNDTVFRLIRPDRLLPVFIIGFGKYKLNFKDGLNPNFNMSDKYVLNSLFETNDFMLIRYTQNYDCPLTRKNHSVKFFNALFVKKEGKLYHQPEFTYEPHGLINDLDGGMSFWPDFITPHGEMMKLVTGKLIKDYVYSAAFKELTLSDVNRQKQISLASGLRPTDMILIIVK